MTFPRTSLSYVVLAIVCASAAPHAAAQSGQPLLTPQTFQALPSRQADHRIAYDKDPSAYGDLRVPGGPGLHPLVVLVHGGCWKSSYATLRDLAPMAEALKAAGIATWNLEYRRLGEAGGGWPGTYLDVGRGVDYVRTLAGPYRLDLSRVVVVGHSAGGHLAMWVAARKRLPSSSALYVSQPLPIAGVVDLAGTADMAGYLPIEVGACQGKVVESMLGGTPESVPERYAQSSAITLLPLGIPQVLVWGARDELVPPALAQRYAQEARKAGDHVDLVIDPDAGHFEVASPRAQTWPAVLKAIRELLTGAPRS